MVILIGNTGYIGEQFLYELEKRGKEVYTLSRNNADYYEFDVLKNILQNYNPEFLINCAGFTGKPNVDTCELHKDETDRANVNLPRVIAKACEVTGTPWGHVSSGCIFHGWKKDGSAITEEDETDCCLGHKGYSSYNATKAEGERMIRAVGRHYYIWRLRMPFDELDHPENYISKLLYKYDKLYDSPKNSISHRGDFVSACLDLWLNKCDYGIYNVINSGSVTAREVVEKINKIPALSKNFDFFENEKEFYKIGAKAPKSNCVLDNSKLISSGIEIRGVNEALDDALSNWGK